MRREQILALSKVIKDAEAKEVSSSLNAGKYEVDFSVHIRGFLQKGEDYTQAGTAKADAWKLLAVAMSLLPKSKIEDIIVASEKLSDGDEVAVKKSAEDAISRIKAQLPPTKCNGRVTSVLVYEAVTTTTMHD